MANSLLLKRSSVQGKVPTTTSLQSGEVAMNTYDGNLFFKRTVGGTDSIVSIDTNVNHLSYTRLTSPTTVVSRQSYIADSSGGGFQITLPASPSAGDWVIISDGWSWQTNPITIVRNSQTIYGLAQDLTLNIAGASITFAFDGTTWQVYTQIGAQGGNAVTLTGSQTLTNKTLTSPTINGGTISNITVSGGATVVSNSSTDKYLAIGTHGQIFDDGNLHFHTSSGNVWINSLDGGSINLGLQTNTGTSSVNMVNLGLNAGYGSVAPVYGVRAWINCGYVGTTMTTRGSGNLSVARGAVGVYNFTFGTAMPDGNYTINATAQTPGSNSDCAVNITYNTTPSTTGFSLTVARYGNGNEDTPILHVQVVR